MDTQPYQVKFGDRTEETFQAIGETQFRHHLADAASGREALRWTDPNTIVMTTGPSGKVLETIICEHWIGWPSAEEQELILRLHQETEGRLEAVCAAYGDEERRGSVTKNSDAYGVSPETYARALWSHGRRRGWLS